jgi:Homeodomain-like domain
VSKWPGRFVQERLDGLYDEPRPGAPRTIDDGAIERVVTRTLETPSRGQTHWRLRWMA